MNYTLTTECFLFEHVFKTRLHLNISPGFFYSKYACTEPSTRTSNSFTSPKVSKKN